MQERTFQTLTQINLMHQEEMKDKMDDKSLTADDLMKADMLSFSIINERDFPM